jgi:hypothetical protein
LTLTGALQTSTISPPPLWRRRKGASQTLQSTRDCPQASCSCRHTHDLLHSHVANTVVHANCCTMYHGADPQSKLMQVRGATPGRGDKNSLSTAPCRRPIVLAMMSRSLGHSRLFRSICYQGFTRSAVKNGDCFFSSSPLQRLPEQPMLGIFHDVVHSREMFIASRITYPGLNIEVPSNLRVEFGIEFVIGDWYRYRFKCYTTAVQICLVQNQSIFTQADSS